MINPFAFLARALRATPIEAQHWANFRHAERKPRNLRKGLKQLLPSDRKDFSSDSRPRQFHDESRRQFAAVSAKFGIPRRQRRLLARRRTRAILRGEEVPQL